MFFLAIRHLLSRKKQTSLTLLGIILGTAAYIAISAMMLGFQTFIIDQLVNNDSHLRIQAWEEMLTERSLNSAFFADSTLAHWLKPPSGRKDNAYILNPREWLDRLEGDERVSAASPQIVAQGIATYGKASRGISLVGMDFAKQRGVSNIESSMVSGKFADIGNSGNRIAVGDEFLKKMGAIQGETILLTVGKGLPLAFRIVAVFHLGVKNIDETRIFGALSDVQQLNQTPSRISDIAVRLKDVQLASDVASTYNLMGQEKVQSWDQANEGIMSVFKMQDIVRNSMTISILVVAGFGIYNILSLAVNHKRREIAILRSIGFEPKDISFLFVTQGVILGLVGGAIGLLVGLLASYAMSLIEVSADRGLGGNRMMINFDSIVYVKAIVLALLSASLASYFPARAAGKMEPIDIIRGENS
ncbi:MAG: ABC transporter permease [Pseudobdellovibrionaceae bacterium]